MPSPRTRRPTDEQRRHVEYVIRAQREYANRPEADRATGPVLALSKVSQWADWPEDDR